MVAESCDQRMAAGSYPTSPGPRMMLSMVSAKLFAGRAWRARRRNASGSLRIKGMIATLWRGPSGLPCHKLLQHLLDGGNVLLGVRGLRDIRRELEHRLEVQQRGTQLGDTLRLLRLCHERQAERVVREEVFRIEGERALAIADGVVEPRRAPLALAEAVVGDVVIVVPDVAFGDALLLSCSEQRAEYVVIELAAGLAIEVAEIEVLHVFGGRLGEIAAEAEAVGEPEVRLGGPGVGRDRLSRCVDRLRPELLEAVRFRKQCERHGVIRLALQHESQMADGAIGVARIEQHAGEIGMRFEIAGVDFDGALIGAFGFVVFESSAIGEALVERGFAVVRIEL